MSYKTQVDLCVHYVLKYRVHNVVHGITANLSLMLVGAALRFNSEFVAACALCFAALILAVTASSTTSGAVDEHTCCDYSTAVVTHSRLSNSNKRCCFALSLHPGTCSDSSTALFVVCA
jgi:hypothetical protein